MWAARNHTETTWALLRPLRDNNMGLLRILIGIHACIDAVHTVSVLFPHCAPPRMRDIDRLYISLFVDEAIADDDDEPLLRRILCYWVAAMSLVRALAFAAPTPSNFQFVACMYALEGLALMYEHGMRTVMRTQARIAAFVSLGMSAALLLLLAA